MTYKITGADALRIAERDQLDIYCHANPIADAGLVTIGDARQIAKNDPSLLYVDVSPSGWKNSDGATESTLEGYNVSYYFTLDGMYLGPDSDGVEPRWNDA